MRVPETNLREFRERGFTVVEGFLSAEELEEAQEALWLHYPRPEEYFANPEAYPKFGESQFSGLLLFPYKSWALNRLAFHPDLVEMAERLIGTDELHLYKVELWAKYAGAIDYTQNHHYDYGNHSIVVPRADGKWPQITTFILLSDVSEVDGPTKLVPREFTKDLDLYPYRLEPGIFKEEEVAATAPAGSMLIYETSVVHRGSDFGAPGRSRFALLADFQARGLPWTGKMAWPNRALDANWADVMARTSVRERDLFGFPPPGHEYWNEQTLRDVGLRYPGMDVTPYRR